MENQNCHVYGCPTILRYLYSVICDHKDETENMQPVARYFSTQLGDIDLLVQVSSRPTMARRAPNDYNATKI